VTLTRLQKKNGELKKITKKDILSIIFSVCLVLEDVKMNKDLLMDAFMKYYERSSTKVPFLVWRIATTSHATPAAPSPAARGCDEDETLLRHFIMGL
jgi:hypothetical protein